MLSSLGEGGETDGRFVIRTKDDFYINNVPIGIREKEFRQVIIEDCSEHRPDLIIFDNLGFLIGADYTESTLTHHCIQFFIGLSQKFDCAIITAAHPRKQSTVRAPVTLDHDRDMFFEEVMGPSHFVNSCGSLWGIERQKDGSAYFYGGTQRLSGTAQLITVEVDDEGWFRIVNDFDKNLKLTLHTEKRKHAWEALPETFTYSEANKATCGILRSKNSFTPFWNELRRVGLIVPTEGGEHRGGFRKAK
jgi:hypothetical protein